MAKIIYSVHFVSAIQMLFDIENDKGLSDGSEVERSSCEGEVVGSIRIGMAFLSSQTSFKMRCIPSRISGRD